MFIRTLEIQSLRDAMSRLREENHITRSELDELQLRYDDELYSSENRKKDKDRLEARIATLTEAYDTATAERTDAQSQVVSLLSQVRELRAVLDEANVERSALARARKALEHRMKDSTRASQQLTDVFRPRSSSIAYRKPRLTECT